MKLYAKICNDRGKEDGKGGDKWLEIDLYVGADRIGRVILDYQGGKDWDLSYEKNDGSSSRLIDEKRQKSKGKTQQERWKEDGRCVQCGDWPIDHFESICYDCQMRSVE